MQDPNPIPTATPVLELTEDAFDAQYPLIRNPFNPSAGWAIGEVGGCLFDIMGEEFEFVRHCNPHHVWTLVDGDDGDLYVVSGLRFVNRIGYLVSERPVPPGQSVLVHIPGAHEE